MAAAMTLNEVVEQRSYLYRGKVVFIETIDRMNCSNMIEPFNLVRLGKTGMKSLE